MKGSTMKRGNPRGGTVDGIRGESLIELAKLCDATDVALSKYLNKRGLEFDYHGHHIVMDPPNRKNSRKEEEEDEPMPIIRKAPIDPLAQALKARWNYNKQGIARRGLLMRKAI